MRRFKVWIRGINIHAVKRAWEDTKTELAIILVDADNAFNRLNRSEKLKARLTLSPTLTQEKVARRARASSAQTHLRF